MKKGEALDRLRYVGFVLLSLVCILMLSAVGTAQAAPQNLTDVQISNFRLTLDNGNPIPDTGLELHQTIRLSLDWDASGYGYGLHAGDYFEIALPDAMFFPNDPGYRDFELLNGETPAQVVANGHISANSPGGGRVRITFTDYVEGKSNIKGYMHMFARVIATEDSIGDNVTFTVSMGSQTVISNAIKVNPQVGPSVMNEPGTKWVETIEAEAGQLRWVIRVNAWERQMTGIKIADSMTASETAITYIPGSFVLVTVLYNHDSNGAIIGQDHILSSVNVSDQVNMALDRRSFTYEMPDTVKYSDDPLRYYTYIFSYRTTYVPGTRAANTASMDYNEGNRVEGGTSIITQQAGGGGVGEYTGAIATKRWEGGPASDHELATLVLLQNGVAMQPQPSPAISGAAPEYTYTWQQLPVRDAGNVAYSYSAIEANVVDGQVTLPSGNSYVVDQAGSVITNTYFVPIKATVTLSALKQYEGAALEEGAFSFQLLAADQSTVLQQVQNAADQSISFAPIEFEAPGTYVLYVKEVSSSAPGISYDDSLYRLTYVVSLGSNQQLTAQLTELTKDGSPMEPDAVIQFDNSYTPPPEPEEEEPSPSYPTIEVPLSLKKELRNGRLQAGAFTFQLRDGAGKLLAEASNAADGSVVFPNRTFSRVVSNYRYTIQEVVGSDKRINYDSTIYTVKVSTRAVAGVLEATVAIERDGTPYAGQMVFVNTRQMPATGDSSHQAILLLVVASLILISGSALLKRRQTKG